MGGPAAAYRLRGGRDPERLAGLTQYGADEVVPLGTGVSDVVRVAADVDVVLDYLWGATTAEVMAGIAATRSEPGKPLTWVEIGSMAGPSAALRALRLQIVGSGQGSIPARDLLAELPAIADEITGGGYRLDVRAVPLSEVEAAWRDFTADQRIVITPA
ncbi:hypothetical protein [Mycobacterium sp. 050134]|uniref:hypothetical protein n=1 Tax=Mycobacterium sp. 050134 TaxID=3096111 RepID=UPI002ED9E66F